MQLIYQNMLETISTNKWGRLIMAKFISSVEKKNELYIYRWNGNYMTSYIPLRGIDLGQAEVYFKDNPEGHGLHLD